MHSSIYPPDTGSYECEPYANRRVETTRSLSAAIRGKHNVQHCLAILLMFTVFGPQITIHPTNTSAAAPFSGIFTCSGRGRGNVSIYWMKENSDLPSKSIITLMSSPSITNTTLVIPNVTEDDLGRYYCIVWADSYATKSKVAQLFFSGTV